MILVVLIQVALVSKGKHSKLFTCCCYVVSHIKVNGFYSYRAFLVLTTQSTLQYSLLPFTRTFIQCIYGQHLLSFEGQFRVQYLQYTMQMGKTGNQPPSFWLEDNQYLCMLFSLLLFIFFTFIPAQIQHSKFLLCVNLRCNKPWFWLSTNQSTESS